MGIVAVCLPPALVAGDDAAAKVEGVPVLSDFAQVAAVAERIDAHSVAVLACPEQEGVALRRLARVDNRILLTCRIQRCPASDASTTQSTAPYEAAASNRPVRPACLTSRPQRSLRPNWLPIAFPGGSSPASVRWVTAHWARFILNSQVVGVACWWFGVGGLVGGGAGASRSFAGGVLAVASGAGAG